MFFSADITKKRGGNMSVKIRIPTPLRRVTNGQDRLEVDANTIRGGIDEMEQGYPGIKARLVDDQGELKEFVNIYANGEDIRFLDGLNTQVKDGDEVSIVPAVAGGER
jgi:molybdopterin synthase sulfur carrier subunit